MNGFTVLLKHAGGSVQYCSADLKDAIDVATRCEPDDVVKTIKRECGKYVEYGVPDHGMTHTFAFPNGGFYELQIRPCVLRTLKEALWGKRS